MLHRLHCCHCCFHHRNRSCCPPFRHQSELPNRPPHPNRRHRVVAAAADVVSFAAVFAIAFPCDSIVALVVSYLRLSSLVLQLPLLAAAFGRRHCCHRRAYCVLLRPFSCLLAP